MKTLNLYNSEASQIKYKVSRFPDGQCQITIDERIKVGNSGLLDYHLESTHSVDLLSRMNSFSDLELIICATQALMDLGVIDIHLTVPYFLGSRSDRKFEYGSCNYLKKVICPIINSLQFASVNILDPHSDVLEACLDNFHKISNDSFYDWVREELSDLDITLVSPDGGALKKIYNASKVLKYEEDIVTCSKYRDTDGKLSMTHVPINGSYHTDKTMVIVDDICDGGRTFINIAKRIADYKYNNKLILVVTHGIFSAGLKELSQYFDTIYCTNSYRDINSMTEFGMHNERYLGLIKQFDVFS